jgi:ribA/ribD-fused uncharacterized protein
MNSSFGDAKMAYKSIVDDQKIAGFFGAFRWLSNFHVSPCTVRGVTYGSSEAAYQAQKCPTDHPDHSQWTQKFVSASPKEAKALSYKVPLRSDWESVKVGIMRECLRSKFSDPNLMTALLDTGSRELIEMNSWGDRFWGTDETLVGENTLGKLLMEVREELRNTEFVEH